MVQLRVRNLDEDIKARLKRRADQHGLGMEEVRPILSNAATDAPRPTAGRGFRIAARCSGTGLTGELLELCGEPTQFARLALIVLDTNVFSALMQ